MDFVHAIAFGPRGEVWYGTVGNGGGFDRRRTDLAELDHDQLGPEWQYVIPAGIATRGDTTVIGTADGLQVTTDDGAALDRDRRRDRAGGARAGRYGLALLDNEYVRRLSAVTGGWRVRTCGQRW